MPMLGSCGRSSTRSPRTFPPSKSAERRARLQVRGRALSGAEDRLCGEALLPEDARDGGGVFVWLAHAPHRAVDGLRVLEIAKAAVFHAQYGVLSTFSRCYNPVEQVEYALGRQSCGVRSGGALLTHDRRCCR